MKSYRLFIPGLLVALSSCTQPISNTGAPASNANAVGPNTLNVADAAIAGGNPAMALSVAQSVLQDNPNDVDAMIHEGDAYYALQRCPDSIAAYALALKIDPKSSVAETGLGRCYIKTDPKSAETAFLAAIRDNPENAAALNDLGIARDLQGNFAGAVDPYQKALLAQPGLTAVEVNLGLSLALSGQAEAALQYLGPLATGPDATPKIRQNYAAALVAAGRVADARQVLGVDLPPDQVDNALAGFNAVIAGSQPAAEPVKSASRAAVASQVLVSEPTIPVTASPLTAQPQTKPALQAQTLAPVDHSAANVEVQSSSLNSVADAQSAGRKMSQAMPAL